MLLTAAAPLFAEFYQKRIDQRDLARLGGIVVEAAQTIEQLLRLDAT